VAAVSLVQGTWQMNPVVSGSMRPGFAVGGVVISERIPVNQLVLRDVIVFKDPENPADLIVHRIVHMTVNKSGQTFIKTRGDANNTEDPWTFTIQGKYAYVVRWSVPLLGYAAVAYQNHRGLVLLGAGILFDRNRCFDHLWNTPTRRGATQRRRTGPARLDSLNDISFN